MGLMRFVGAAVVMGFLAHAAAAFEETKIGVGEQKAPAAPVLELPKGTLGTGKDLNLPGTGLNLGRTSGGTEVRIPGLGTVGVLPKLDFGLELLYGANEPSALPQDKTSPDDVQIRGTIKHRF
jgi:hypothetical protein